MAVNAPMSAPTTCSGGNLGSLSSSECHCRQLTSSDDTCSASSTPESGPCPPCPPPPPCQCHHWRNIHYLMCAVYAGVFFQTVAFHMQHCAVNRLVHELRTGSRRFAILQSWRPVFLALGCPFFGHLCDVWGSAFGLELSMILSATAYVMQMAACSELFLIVASLPLLLVHSYQGSQMVIADTTCGDHRAGAFAKLALAFKLGIITGPTIGQYFLDNWGSLQAILLAAMMSILCTVAIHLYVLECIGWNQQHFNCQHALLLTNVRHIVHLMMTNEVFVLTLARIVVGIPFHVLQLYYPICLVEYYTPAYENVSCMFNYLRFSDIVLLMLWMVLMCYFRNDVILHRGTLLATILAYLMIGFCNSFVIFTAAYILLSSCMVILTLVTRTSVSKLVCRHERGTALGILMMVELLLPQTPFFLRAVGMVDRDVNVAAVSRFGVVASILTTIVLFTVFRGRN